MRSRKCAGAAFGGILQHGPPVLRSSGPPLPEPFPSELLPSALRETSSICSPPSGSIGPPPPASVSPKTAAKGLLSFMSNQPKFVPHPRFDQLSSEAAIWEDFCCSSSFEKQLRSQGSPASSLMLMSSITEVIYAGPARLCGVARPPRNYLTSRGRRKSPPGKWLQLQRADRDATEN